MRDLIILINFFFVAFDLSCFVFFSVVAFLLFVRLRFFLHFLCPICCSWIPLIVYLDSCHDTLLLLLNLYFVFLNHFLTLIKPMVYTPNLPLKFPLVNICLLMKTTVPPIPCSIRLFCGVRRKLRLPLQCLTRGSRADSATWGNWYWRNKVRQRRNRKRKTGMTCSV